MMIQGSPHALTLDPRVSLANRTPPAAMPTPKVGTMDLEPIYCAEQIKVPPDLADILKAYTKEVVRRQPEDVYEFSAIYFSNLASVSASTVEEPVPPTTTQIKEVYATCKGKLEMSLAELTSSCTDAGVKLATVEQAFRLGEFAGDAVNPTEPLALLLTMTDASFVGIVTSLFEVFGEDDKLAGSEFMALFEFLTAKDTTVRAESVTAMREALIGQPSVGFGDVNKLEAFQQIVDGAL